MTLAPQFISHRFVLRSQLSVGKRIVLEGTQGFGLSLLHSPFIHMLQAVTRQRRFVSEVALVLGLDEVVMVLRAFPIRVAGNLAFGHKRTGNSNEESGSQRLLLNTPRHKSKKSCPIRPGVVRGAIEVNTPTRIVLTISIIDYACREMDSLSQRLVVC